jgi:hypothetical protein
MKSGTNDGSANTGLPFWVFWKYLQLSGGYVTTGLTKFDPEEGHIILKGPILRPHLCETISKRGEGR